MEINELSKNAMGGTELMLRRLHNNIDKELLDKFQIIPSRIRELNPDKKKIFWAHDLPEDPESLFLTDRFTIPKFEAFVFVSHYQLTRYKLRYPLLPIDKCFVIENAIETFDCKTKEKTDQIKLIYTSTPHRGLDLLLHVFDKLSKEYNITLDVFSSFKLYGWKERDEAFKPLFDYCNEHPKINYHGTVKNLDIRKALSESDIFVLPSTWEETSCICLIEALSHGLECVHSSLGALPETAKGWSNMYQYSTDAQIHINRLEHALRFSIEENINFKNSSLHQKLFFSSYHSIDKFKTKWTNLLSSIK